MSDKFSKEQRSRNMSLIKSTNTKEEIRLAKALWAKGYRYRKNNKKIFGTPDLTFKKQKVAIFVDGEFFHGHNWEEAKFRIKSNTDYWIPKIERNMKRDIEVNEYLESNGWKIIRFWSKYVRASLDNCISVIENALASYNAK